jgi:hypothetical protein
VELRPATGPSVWHADELTPDEWCLRPGPTVLSEWERLLDQARVGAPADELVAGGELVGLVRHARHELQRGRGFVLVRGLPVEEVAEEALAVAFLAFARLIGAPEPQTRQGDLLFRVADQGAALTGSVRGASTRDALRFHTDGRDAAGLLCVRPGAERGVSSVTSAGAIHNALLDAEPELLEELYEPWHFDRRGAPGTPTSISPVFSRCGEWLSCYYVPHTLRSGPERVGLALSERQEMALERFDGLAQDPSLRLDMRLEPGDLQLLDNYAVLHARSAFPAAPEPGLGRLLLRVWLSLPDRRPLAPGFKYGGGVPKTPAPTSRRVP